MSPDPDSTVYWFHRKGTTGWLGLESAPIDRILDEARAEPASDKRDQLYRQLFDHIIPEATYIYTVHANYLRLARERAEPGAAPGHPGPVRQRVDRALDFGQIWGFPWDFRGAGGA